MKKNIDICIVNRTFWPDNKSLAEGLLCLGERFVSEGYSTAIVFEKSNKFNSEIISESRGNGIQFIGVKKKGSSSSSIIMRGIYAVLFSISVMFNLLKLRPKVIYISTDPPVLVPFIVFIISKITGSKYVYHFQDIHPEITNHVTHINFLLYKMMFFMDKVAQRNALMIITITEEMKKYLCSRVLNSPNIHLVTNPTNFEFNQVPADQKKKGFVFCGNAGRLQLMDLLIEAVQKYYQDGGNLDFTFIGGGIYSSDLKELDKNFPKFHYLGFLASDKCNEITATFEWALLPIDESVLDFAFPSKTSSYLACGNKILAISKPNSALSRWVSANKVGLNVEPNVTSIINCFFKIENKLTKLALNSDFQEKNTKLSPIYFADTLYNLIESHL
jgi:glycosyltransferase involved in cell wall biosynthesis